MAGLDDWFAGRIAERIEFSGDHVGFMLEPVAARVGDDGPELSFQEAKDIEPGHEP